MHMVHFTYKIFVYNLFTIYTYILGISLKTCLFILTFKKLLIGNVNSLDRTAKSGTKERV